MTFKLCIYKQISSLFITQKTLGTNLPVRPPCFAHLARDYWILGFQFDTLGVVPVVLDTLILSSIRCACPRYAVPVRDTLCLSAIRCACPRYAVPVRDTLCLSSIRCACPKHAVPVLDTLCLSAIRCACPRYAVPVRDTLCLSLIH